MTGRDLAARPGVASSFGKGFSAGRGSTQARDGLRYSTRIGGGRGADGLSSPEAAPAGDWSPNGQAR